MRLVRHGLELVHAPRVPAAGGAGGELRLWVCVRRHDRNASHPTSGTPTTPVSSRCARARPPYARAFGVDRRCVGPRRPLTEPGRRLVLRRAKGGGETGWVGGRRAVGRSVARRRSGRPGAPAEGRLRHALVRADPRVRSRFARDCARPGRAAFTAAASSVCASESVRIFSRGGITTTARAAASPPTDGASAAAAASTAAAPPSSNEKRKEGARADTSASAASRPHITCSTSAALRATGRTATSSS